MKKNLFFALMFCFSLSLTSFKAPETTKLDGDASDCVAYASGVIRDVSQAAGDDPNVDHHSFYLELYMDIYTRCLD